VTDPRLPPLPQDLERLFAEANEQPVPAELVAQVRGRVTRAMVLRGVPGFDDPGGGDGGGSPNDGGSGGPPGDGGGAAGPGGGGGAGALAAAGGGVVAKTAAVKLAALAATVGLAVGVGAGHTWGVQEGRRSETLSQKDDGELSRPAQVAGLAADAGEAEDGALPAPAMPPTVLWPAERPLMSPLAPPTGARAPAASASSEAALGRSALRRERELIDAAASAMRSGNAQQALDVSEQHKRQFPRGQLAEEREAVAIEALVTLGRREAARARLDGFRRTYPASAVPSRLEAQINSSDP
jgi:hypothetical protein